jgi:hypothetical protein
MANYKIKIGTDVIQDIQNAADWYNDPTTLRTSAETNIRICIQDKHIL